MFPDVRPSFFHAAETIREYRPELYEEYMEHWHRSAGELVVFMDRHFPVKGGWGVLPISSLQCLRTVFETGEWPK